MIWNLSKTDSPVTKIDVFCIVISQENTAEDGKCRKSEYSDNEN